MRFRHSLNTKLVYSFLAGSLIIVVLFSLVIRAIVNDYFDRQARVRDQFVQEQGQREVRTNLGILKDDFDEVLANMTSALLPLAESGYLGDRLPRTPAQREATSRVLRELRRRTRMSMITIVDEDGRTLVRATNPSEYGDTTLMMTFENPRGLASSTRELITAALSGQVIQSFELFAPEVLERELHTAADGSTVTLAELARIPLKTTTNRPVAEGEVENRGLVLSVVLPVKTSGGTVAGVLVAARLINKDPSFVDNIRNLLDDHSSIFLGSVRIATTLRINTGPNAGQNAVGTLLTEETSGVLGRGEYVERESNIAGERLSGLYEPIRSHGGQVIGALWLGRPLSAIESISRSQLEVEQAVNRRTSLYILALGVASFLISIGIATLLARRLTSRIDTLRLGAEIISQGNLDHRLNIHSGDEIEQLAQQFNAMAEKLHDSYHTLELKVEKRTRELKESQETLIQQEKMVGIGQLAAGIAHELNTPLGTIIGYAQMLREDLVKEGHAANPDDAGEIIDQAGRCRDLVKNLLNFSRRSTTEKTGADLNSIVRRIAALIEHDFHLKRVRIHLELDSTLPTAYLNENEIGQVILNLANNAVDSMPDGGDIFLRTQYLTVDDRISLEVSDTGCGIREPDRKRIFEPFFTTKEVGKGTGLGLSICYKIVENHLGSMEFDSVPGKGTTFRVLLPVKYAPAEVRIG